VTGRKVDAERHFVGADLVESVFAAGKAS